MPKTEWETFEDKPDRLTIESLNSLLYIFKGKKLDAVTSKAFQLAEDLPNGRGSGILFPKETELTNERIESLVKIKGLHPKIDFKVTIKKSKELADFFRQVIVDDITRSVKSKSTLQEFRKSMFKIEKFLGSYVNDILDHDEMIYTLYNARAINERASDTGIPIYFYHAINSAVFAIIILQNAFFAFGKHFQLKDIINVTRAALMNDIGALIKLGPIANLPKEALKSEYVNLKSQSASISKRIGLQEEIVDSIKKTYDLEIGKEISASSDDDKTADFANVLFTANLLDSKISGLFENRVPVKSAVDEMYVKSSTGGMRRSYIDSLAKGLRLNQLFDFYFEMERLRKSCIKGDFARAYPMLGFKSPVLFLCKARKLDCPQYSPTSKSVTLLRPSSGLEPGAYGRCKFLSKALVKFYESHYDNIKDEIRTEQDETSLQKKPGNKKGN